MEIKPLTRTIKGLLLIGGLATGWIAHAYLPFTQEKTEVQAPHAQHAIHFAQLGVPDSESFGGANALYDKFSREGDHLEYPLTMLCGCTFKLTQWGIASESQSDLEGKIFQVKHTPITFWNKRLWFIGDEVDAEGKPLAKEVSPGGGM